MSAGRQQPRRSSQDARPSKRPSEAQAATPPGGKLPRARLASREPATSSGPSVCSWTSLTSSADLRPRDRGIPSLCWGHGQLSQPLAGAPAPTLCGTHGEKRRPRPDSPPSPLFLGDRRPAVAHGQEAGSPKGRQNRTPHSPLGNQGRAGLAGIRLRLTRRLCERNSKQETETSKQRTTAGDGAHTRGPRDGASRRVLLGTEGHGTNAQVKESPDSLACSQHCRACPPT